jgi:hypothetical protein
MGFNKRYVDRESILNNISRIDSFLDTDSIICMDLWSSQFISGLNKLERSDMEKLREKYQFHSGSYDDDSIFRSMKSVSENLRFLMISPDWADIQLSIRLLGIQVDKSEYGNFDDLLEKCIGKAIEYFDR